MASIEKGDVFVVWVDKSNIYFSSTHGSDIKFSIPIVLNSNISNNTAPSSPQLAATEKGDVYVVRVEENNATGASNIIFRASNDNGNNFERSVRLNRNSNQTFLSGSPLIAATEKGKVFAIWPENSLRFKEIIDNRDILGRTISLGSDVVMPLSLQIDVSKSGNIYLAWAEKRSNANDDVVFVFKKISEFYFDRN